MTIVLNTSLFYNGHFYAAGDSLSVTESEAKGYVASGVAYIEKDEQPIAQAKKETKKGQ